MNANDLKHERLLLDRIYRKHIRYKQFFGHTRAYYTSRNSWLKTQGCNINKKKMWDSDARRIEFMLRWL